MISHWQYLVDLHGIIFLGKSMHWTTARASFIVVDNKTNALNTRLVEWLTDRSMPVTPDMAIFCQVGKCLKVFGHFRVNFEPILANILSFWVNFMDVNGEILNKSSILLAPLTVYLSRWFWLNRRGEKGPQVWGCSKIKILVFSFLRCSNIRRQRKVALSLPLSFLNAKE